MGTAWRVSVFSLQVLTEFCVFCREVLQSSRRAGRLREEEKETSRFLSGLQELVQRNL